MLCGANAVEIRDIERMNIGAHQPGVWDVTMSYERRCQVKKTPPAAGRRIFFWASSPDFLNVRARSVSLFLRVVFSRKAAARPCEAASLFFAPVVSFQYRGGVTKQGSPLLRFLWCEAGAHAVRRDPELKRFYRRKLVQKGLGKARVAVARKLGIRLWIMLRTRLITKSSVVAGRSSKAV
jgi:hypothetical protein